MKRLALLVLALASCTSAPPAAMTAPDDLFRDDFSRYPIGRLSWPVGEINPAIQEYHYLANRGVDLSPWEMPLVYMDAWAVGEEDGKPYLEQHLSPDNQRMNPKLLAPLFVTGDPEWSDATVEVSMKPLATDLWSGVAFRYHTNRDYYLFALEGGKKARLVVRMPLETKYQIADWRVLAEADFPYDTARYYRLKVENEGANIRASIDGKVVLQAEDAARTTGKVGVAATLAARYMDFRVSAPPAAREAIAARVAKRQAEEAALQAANPKPKLWKKFDTVKFGCGRNVRFGDLDGDGRLDMLFAQIIAKVDSGNFVEASCLTAVNLDGKVLWQIGKPNPRNGLLTSDTPFQIHDVDGDGKNEVILVKDFKLQVLDGATGRLKKWMWMPPVPADRKLLAHEIKERPHDLNAGDSISFFDLSGKKRRSELLLKDRYRNFWVYSEDFKLLWTGHGQLGHFPYPYDLDGDGRDEVLIGYAAWTPDGKQLWSQDEPIKDHADGLAAGNFTGSPGGETRVYAVGSDEGFMVFDLKGNMLNHQRVGHTQNMTIAKLRPDMPGLQIATINFWKNPGILTVFDPDGKILQQGEPHHCGSMILPVNWRGDGQEFLLLSGNVREGGMLDGRLRRAVVFPDDGHPDLAAWAGHVTGDARDEVILWDQERVWIYTQDGLPPAGKVYAPARNPHYNDSNYRAQVSLPGWSKP
jgi:hypothetical protein